mgnify:CR=1 FL=1
MIYQILKTGAEPHKRFLALTRLGDLFSTSYGSTRFDSIEKAKIHLDRLKSQGLAVHMIYVNTCKIDHLPAWGEVNRDALARIS